MLLLQKKISGYFVSDSLRNSFVEEIHFLEIAFWEVSE